MKISKWLAAMVGRGTGGAAMPAEPPPRRASDHAVIVNFLYGSTDLSRLFAVETQLEAAIASAGAGEYDGNEIAVDGSDGSLYMYGPDADRLFAAIKPILDATPFMHGARVTVRRGPPGDGVREKVVTIAP